MPECHRCGAQAVPDARFCGGCGVPLAGLNRSASVRKYVVVLFADLADSTSLAESTDPEALRTLLARYFKRVSEAVWAHHGAVEKFIGDAVMAVFGVPLTHKEDAHHAVDAARDVLRVVEELSNAFSKELGRELSVRIGVNGGEVFVSRQSDGQFSVTGEAVNVAQRLEAAAEPGQILLGSSVGRLVQDRVRVRRLPAMLHKGMSRLEDVFAVDAARNALSPVAESTPPFVGRQDDMALLRELVTSCRTARSGYALTLVAEAGMGKTRLTDEVSTTVTECVHLRSAFREGETSTFGPIARILSGLPNHGVAVIDGEGLDGRWAGVAARLATARGENDDLVTPRDLIWAIHAVLERLTRDEPALLVWDDLHLASEGQLALLPQLTSRLRDLPVLTVYLARAQLFERSPGWGGGRGARVTDLQPLSREAIRQIVVHAAGEPSAPDDVLADFVERSDGSPLVAQILGQWREESDLIPPSARMLFVAAVESLTADQRSVCEAAAVLAADFDVDDLAAVAELDVEDTAAVVSELRNLNILAVPGDANALDVGSVSFVHQLLRQTTYDLLPKVERALQHHRAATQLRASPRPKDHLVLRHLDGILELASEITLPSTDLDEVTRWALELRGERIRELWSRGDPQAQDEIRKLAALLPAFDDAHLDLVFQVLTLPDADVDGVTGLVDELAAHLTSNPWWIVLRGAVSALVDLRRGTVQPTELLPQAGQIEDLLPNPDMPVGARLLSLLFLGQVFAMASCFSSCREVARAGISLGEALGHPSVSRLFRALQIQVDFFVPETYRATIEVAERHLRDIEGDARQTSMINAVLTAAHAFVGDRVASELCWNAVLSAPAGVLQGDDFLVARQYNALRLEVVESSAAAADEWADMADAAENPRTHLGFRASASDAYVRAGLLDKAREQQVLASESSGDPAELPRRFALFHALDDALHANERGMAEHLALLDHLQGVEPGSVERALSLAGRAMVLIVQGTPEAARAPFGEARESLRSLGATALCDLIDRLGESAEAIRVGPRVPQAHAGSTRKAVKGDGI